MIASGSKDKRAVLGALRAVVVPAELARTVQVEIAALLVALVLYPALAALVVFLERPVAVFIDELAVLQRGKPVKIAAFKAPAFKAGKQLKDALN